MFIPLTHAFSCYAEHTLRSTSNVKVGHFYMLLIRKQDLRGQKDRRLQFESTSPLVTEMYGSEYS